MVQRYGKHFNEYIGMDIVKKKDGEYVKYDDYQILKDMYDALSEKWLDVNGQHGALCDACISYGLEPTDMIKNELAK